MAANYRIVADVVDIATDVPKAEDFFYVDTNVWFWLTYSRASLGDSPPLAYQSSEYPNFLKKCLSAGSILIKTGLSFSELAHLIEKIELEIYSKSSGANLKTKEYRHNLPTQRTSVVNEISTAWNQVDGIGIQMEIRIEELLTRAALTRIKSQCLDGYDAFAVETLLKTKYKNVLTDDGDFSTVNGITVFTANKNLINQARSQGRLVIR